MAITSKKINLGQLDQELGGHGLVADFNDEKKKIVLTADNSPITDEELELAIKNHVAGPTRTQIMELNRQQGLAKLRELGFTDEQIKALLNS
jgi:hypothetical protein